MASDSLRVVAIVTAQADKADELKLILLGLIGPTRAEAGCLSYQLQQNNSDASEFVFIEEWTNDAALDLHLTTSHLQDALSRAQPLLACLPDIRRYSKIA
jgi:quinol monooxygenase YgiN